MKVNTVTIPISTIARNELKDVTQEVQGAIISSDIKDGVVVVFIPHTTAGVTINENADMDVRSDMNSHLDKIIPWVSDYKHFEGNSAAHLKASLFGASVTIPITNGRLMLGTWQGIYFAEFDGPRQRRMFIKTMGA